MNKLNFVKYSGNGNDFVIFQGKVNLTSQLISILEQPNTSSLNPSITNLARFSSLHMNTTA
jgi:hypothetical protein